MMRSIVGPEMGVKASGGVRNYETAVQMLKAGANKEVQKAYLGDGHA